MSLYSYNNIFECNFYLFDERESHFILNQDTNYFNKNSKAFSEFGFLIVEVPHLINFKYQFGTKTLKINDFTIDKIDIEKNIFRQKLNEFILDVEYINTKETELQRFIKIITRKPKNKKVFIPTFLPNSIITKDFISIKNDTITIINIDNNLINQIIENGNLLFLYLFFKNKINIVPFIINSFSKKEKKIKGFTKYFSLQNILNNISFDKIAIEVAKLGYITNITHEFIKKNYLNQNNNNDISSIKLEIIPIIHQSQYIINDFTKIKIYQDSILNYIYIDKDNSSIGGYYNQFYVDENINTLISKSLRIYPCYSFSSATILSEYNITAFGNIIFDLGGRILKQLPDKNDIIVALVKNPNNDEFYIIANSLNSEKVRIYKSKIINTFLIFAEIEDIIHLIDIDKMQCTGEVKYIKNDKEEFLCICGYLYTQDILDSLISTCKYTTESPFIYFIDLHKEKNYINMFIIYNISKNKIVKALQSDSFEYTHTINIENKHQLCWYKSIDTSYHILFDYNTFNNYDIIYKNIEYSNENKLIEFISPSNVFYIPEKKLVVAIGKNINTKFPSFTTYTINIDDKNQKVILDYKHKLYNKYYFSGALLKKENNYYIVGLEEHKIDIYDLNCELKTTMDLNDDTYKQCITLKNGKILITGKKFIKLLQYNQTNNNLEIIQSINLNSYDVPEGIILELYLPPFPLFYFFYAPKISTYLKQVFFINKDRRIVAIDYE